MNNDEQPNVIVCEDLHKRFADGKLFVDVLKGINFKLRAGERVAIIGKSGAGKSTLLQCLGGVDIPTTGSVVIDGQRINHISERKRCRLRNQKLGFVYQFHHLLPEFTALENVMMPALIAKQSREQASERAHEILNAVGLADRETHKLSELSGGERQRVAIARALVNQPACVLADEPTGNLDKSTAEQVYEMMLEQNAKHQTALVVVTHDLELASRMDRVLELEHGELKPSVGAT